MKKFFLLTAAVALVCNFAMAKENRDAQNQIVRGPYETNDFWSNWFIGVDGGINFYEGEGFKKGDLFKDHAGYSFDANIGKWLTPSLGIRGGFTLSQVNGLTRKNAPFAGDVWDKTKKLYEMEFDFYYFHADVMWNLSNALSGYRSDRRWDVIPYVTTGVVRASGNDTDANGIALGAGLFNKIRLSDVTSLTLDLRQIAFKQEMDGVTGGKRFEGDGSARIGLMFNIGQKKNFKRITPADPNAVSGEKFAALRNENAALQDRLNRLQQERDRLAAAANAPKPAAAQTTYEAGQMGLFFKINSAKISKQDAANLDFYVTNALKADSNKVFTVIGSADKETGTKPYNKSLSQKRAEAVAKILQDKYNIKASNITIEARGDENNMFEDAILNRVVIVK